MMMRRAGPGDARSARPLYGVDGFPYLVGLALASSGLLAAGALGLRGGPRTRFAASAALVAGSAAAVPVVLGARYVVTGKLALREQVLDAVSWHGDEVVVDLGAGSGLLGLAAAARTTGTVHCVDLFIGKDLSGNTPQRLLRNAAILGVVGQVQLQRADVRATRLPAACADVALSSLCLHNLADVAAREAALDEIGRVLRPGGTVVITDLAHVKDEYAPYLSRTGFTITRMIRLPGTFPPQRLLVAQRGG